MQAVLAARIDRLPPEEKAPAPDRCGDWHGRALAPATDIAELPEAALYRGLAHVQAAEFLYETRLFPSRTHLKHALTHEVVRSLLHERRRDPRRAWSMPSRRSRPTRRLEQVERLAHHAAGRGVGQGRHLCQQAGARADDRLFREAVASFEQASGLAHLPEDGDSRMQVIELRLALGGSTSNWRVWAEPRPVG